MTYKAIAVKQHNFSSKDKLFLDANIWFYVFGPHRPGDPNAVTYSDVFNCILNAQSQIYIDVLVVSEFINAYSRRKWKLIARHIKLFKDFRNSPVFKPVAQDIADDVKQIMKCCSRIESGFAMLDITRLINDYATGDFDFNDQVITEICKSNGLTLITNDSDFKTQEIPILTANSNLL